MTPEERRELAERLVERADRIGHPPVRSTPWLLRSSGRRRLAPSFPTAQEAVDAAFATDQIEPRGDQG